MPSKYTVAVVLNDDLIRRVRKTAARETISISAVVRQALLSYFFGPTMTRSHIPYDSSSNDRFHLPDTIPSPADLGRDGATSDEDLMESRR